MEGNTDTNSDGIFVLYGIFYLTFVPYRKQRFTAGFSETSIRMYQTTRRHVPKDIFAVFSIWTLSGTAALCNRQVTFLYVLVHMEFKFINFM